jgi:hypothetical protein
LLRNIGIKKGKEKIKGNVVGGIYNYIKMEKDLCLQIKKNKR